MSPELDREVLLRVYNALKSGELPMPGGDQ